MRILMTGGFGCIGSWIARQCVAEGGEVWIYDLKEDWHRIDMLMDAEAKSRVHYVPGDVTDVPSLRKAAEDMGAEAIMHLAGLQVPVCRSDPLLGAKVNVLGTLAVFETARMLKDQIKRVVYASSAAVHGPSDPGVSGAVADEVRLTPSTHYGAFKVCNELNARVYWLDNGIVSVGLRPWTVYGVGRDFGVTSEPTLALAALAAGGDYAITYGGLQDLQYVEDVAGTFLRAASHPYAGADAFNVRGDVISIEQFVATLEEVIPEARGRVTHGARQLPIAPSLDDSRLERHFGPLPRTPLAVGIRRTYDLFRELARQGQG